MRGSIDIMKKEEGQIRSDEDVVDGVWCVLREFVWKG